MLNHRRLMAAVALLVTSPILAPVPAQAQGPDDFLNHLSSIGIGNLSDSHNFDLVGFGNALCWRLYAGQSRAEITQEIVANSRSNTQVALSPQQAQAALSFAISDLCPDAAPT